VQAIEVYEVAEERKREQLKRWQIEENNIEEPEPWE
jgi:hypothetical protein